MPAEKSEKTRKFWSKKKLTLLGVLVFLGALGWFGWVKGSEILCPAPCVDLSIAKAYKPKEATLVFDRDGLEIGRFAIEDRRVRKISELPKSIPNAFLAIEDQRFYKHGGIDLIRIMGVIWHNLRKERRQGASTITMQLARNLYPEALPKEDRGWRRKTKEMAVARQLEKMLTKDEILERYINTIYLGQGAYGVEAAAHSYFNLPADSLNLAQAATLAALARSPSSENPHRNPKAAKERRNIVIHRMKEMGVITEAEENRWSNEPLKIFSRAAWEARRQQQSQSYFIEAVRKQMAAILGDNLYRGGLKIYTTLDSHLQEGAEISIAKGLARIEAGKHGKLARKNKTDSVRAPLQAALVSLDPTDGSVRAMVGGRSFEHSEFNRATQSRRQSGSAFKPFIYAAALAGGWRGFSEISDGPVSVPMSDGTVWTPRGSAALPEEDSLGEQEMPLVTLATALAWSRNAATVRLALAVGLDTVAKMAYTAGALNTPQMVPAMTLGAGEVSPLQLTSAYQPFFRADGQLSPPKLVDSVTNGERKKIWAPKNKDVPVLNHETAVRMRRLLQGVVQRGTASGVKKVFKGEAAGKTGTTNEGSDLWFVGGVPGSGDNGAIKTRFGQGLVTGLWIGYDLPGTVVQGQEGTGGHLAAPIWADFMALAMPDSGKGLAWPKEAKVKDEDSEAMVTGLPIDSPNTTEEPSPPSATGRIEIQTPQGVMCVAKVGPINQKRTILVPCDKLDRGGPINELPPLEPVRPRDSVNRNN